ncbi:MBOAT family O-acyltransferase [Pseudooceanicola nanhaiensis]|uniref:MBOAT family O-acyltransferase n=1 Tax=Pseudooceanicola nanhaiensis TaxID=375761 RepID=UPI001CD33F4C|nr:MBOAT family protein [Pseudooceanicola nanhaiensis]MCA0921171.1 MBOAT family protein [Pseudooceanicola nanhaiensis]
MLFPTLAFILFYGVVLILNLAVDGRPALRKAMLIAASYVFYGAWDERFLLLMGGVTAVAWLAGLLVTRPGWRRPVLILSITALLGTLGVFKYADFFVLSLSQLLARMGLERDMVWVGLVLPVGISFYVFQAISYVVDVARGDVPARRNAADVALYISFFPQLVAGPIVRARDFLPQIDAPHPPSAGERGEAVLLILTGLLKKLVIANYLGVLLVDPAFATPLQLDTLTAWAALLGYAIQIYCDFSGYSDIAIGVALLLGYRFRRNFNQPYRATSLRDFWRRWHISLSTYIRDYLYIPLGGNRGGLLQQALVLIACFTLSGFWHGAAWSFLLWGLLHGLALAGERLCQARGLRLPALPGWGLTCLIVLLLWLPFRAPDLIIVRDYLGALFGQAAAEAPPILPALWGLLALGLALNWAPLTLRGRAIAVLGRLPAPAQALTLGTGVFLAFAIAQEGTSPFIYFQF